MMDVENRSMRTIEIGQDKIKASVLMLGTWGMGGGSAWADSDDRMSIRVIHNAREMGINFIDSAPVYGTGHSEEILGLAIKDRRSQYVISTKCTLNWRDNDGKLAYKRDGKSIYNNFSKASLRADLEDSLERLSTDYIDIYIVHRQPDDHTKIEEIYHALDSFKKEGKIRSIGISNASATCLAEYLKHGRVDLVQEKFSILDISPMTDYLPLCQDNGVVFQGFSVLERGLLTGEIGMDYLVKEGDARKSIKYFMPELRQKVIHMLDGWRDICIAHDCSMSNLIMAVTHTMIPCFLVGVRKMDHLVEAAKSLSIQLYDSDMKKIMDDLNMSRQSFK